MKNKKGFTLIELLVVIAIIGLLSTLALVSLNTARQRSRDTKRQADIRTMQSAIELFVNENGTVPLNDATPTWDELATNLDEFLASSNLPEPPGTGGACVPNANPTTDCYFYCENATNYLTGASLVEGTEPDGDVDGTDASYANATDCVSNAGVFTAAPAIDCTTKFCLGTL